MECDGEVENANIKMENDCVAFGDSIIFHFEIYILHLGCSSIARRARHGVPIEE